MRLPSLTKNQQRTFDLLTISFIASIIFYQVIYLIVPVRKLLVESGLDIFSSIMALAGFLLFITDFILNRTIIKIRSTYPLIALIGIMCVSALFNISYGVVDNAKIIIWQTVQLFVVFTAYQRLSLEKWKKVCYALYWILGSVYTISICISFGMYIQQESYVVKVGDALINQGFCNGRLYGVFSSPHFAAIPAIIIAFSSIYYLIKANLRRIKVLHALIFIINFFYAGLCAARSTVVATCVSLAIIVPIVVYKILQQKNVKNCLYRITASVLALVLIIIIIPASFNTTKKLSACALKLYINSTFDNSTTEKPSYTPNAFDDLELERNDVNTENITNGRQQIWTDYIDVTCDKVNTLLFGFSAGNYMKCISEQYPEKFIVRYIRDTHPEMYENGYIYDTHNSLVTVFAATGLLGLLLLMIFLIWFAVKSITYVIRHTSLSGSVVLLAAINIFILVTSLFDSDLFCRCTSTSVMFWWFVGLQIKGMEAGEVKEGK